MSRCRVFESRLRSCPVMAGISLLLRRSRICDYLITKMALGVTLLGSEDLVILGARGKLS